MKILPYNGCFKNLDTPEKAYWFGFIVGDGCIGIYDIHHIFKMALKDKDPLKELALFLGYPIERVKTRKDGYFSLGVTCKELVIDLMNLGLTPRKSLTVTDSIIPKDYQWDFIRGLWDADGCIHIRKQTNHRKMHPNITLIGTYTMVLAIKNIINEGGSIQRLKAYIGINGISLLSYGGRLVVDKILAKIYYQPPYLERKFKLFEKIRNYGIDNNGVGHFPRKYDIYKDGVSYYERTCLWCGEKFLVTTKSTNRQENRGNFCNRSHSAFYRWKLKREGVGNIATC